MVICMSIVRINSINMQFPGCNIIFIRFHKCQLYKIISKYKNVVVEKTNYIIKITEKQKFKTKM